MCGITAYAGKESALPFLLQGLEKLEYRGYDSAGVTLVSNHHLETYKAKGRLTNLKELLNEKEHPEHTGIGHTRWAIQMRVKQFQSCTMESLKTMHQSRNVY